jgi:RNA-directed DNA polymerase
VYLPYALDLWVEQWRKRRARGDIVVVRYADDFVLGFQHEDEAVRFRHELAERLGRFGLELHPDKTRLFRFGKNAASNQRERGLGKPCTFDFLGLTHICGRSRSGRFVLFRHSSKKRMRAKLHSVRDELRRRLHQSLMQQGEWLASVVRGYLAYHAVPTNAHAIRAFRAQAIRSWHKALRRRSQRDNTTWERTSRLAKRWIPPALILHPWPEARFHVRTRGRSRVR